MYLNPGSGQQWLSSENYHAQVQYRDGRITDMEISEQHADNEGYLNRSADLTRRSSFLIFLKANIRKTRLATGRKAPNS